MMSPSRWTLTGRSVRLVGGALMVSAVASAWWRGAEGAPTPAVRFGAQWLGATTLLLDDGKSSILVDPYFSRASREQVARDRIEPDTARIDAALRRAGATHVVAVLATHSTYDHAMDVPVVAGRTGADIAGSRSTRNIARGLAFPQERIRTFENGEFLAYANFKITALDAPYRTGNDYTLFVERGGRRVLIVSEPGFEPGSMIGTSADIVFLGIGGLAARGEHFASDYWRETVLMTNAKVVYLTQFDDVASPGDDASRTRAQQERDMAIEWMKELGASDHVVVRVPEPYARIDLLEPLP
jgi:L-ascorbate metabolism protein UlaG (beta-lactamase superfamily)